MPGKDALRFPIEAIRITKRPPDPIFIPLPPILSILMAPFEDHAKKVGGAPGEAVSGIEASGGGKRVRYQNGAIYQREDGGTAWVHGAINDRYNELGAGASWLGLPLSDEMDFPQAGKVTVFQHGSIYWWSDTGPIDMYDALVQYTGLICFGETDWDQSSSADEPYVILGVLAPEWNSTVRSEIYEGVDDGESRGALMDLYRGKPNGLIITTRLMEHDFGDANKYRETVGKAVEAAWEGTELGVGYIPFVGPILQKGMDEIWPAVKEDLIDAVNSVLETQDDDLGGSAIVLTPKDMVLLSARTPAGNSHGVVFKKETELLGSNEGASYKIYFTLSAV
jgi:hypothetical protein